MTVYRLTPSWMARSTSTTSEANFQAQENFKKFFFPRPLFIYGSWPQWRKKITRSVQDEARLEGYQFREIVGTSPNQTCCFQQAIGYTYVYGALLRQGMRTPSFSRYDTTTMTVFLMK